MTTQAQNQAAELAADIVDVVAQIRSTEGLPEATRETCDNSVHSIHGSLHGLALWLRELLEWAPLKPATRASAIRLSHVLTDADAAFHTAPEQDGDHPTAWVRGGSW